jgi:hypothetical protein
VGRFSVAGRLFLFCGTLLLLLAELVRGEGIYQRTRDGKTVIWNNYPKPGDLATWSGGRDGDGYARGFGQLTWYSEEEGFDKPQLYARYWGRMADGKLEGPVNVHVNGKTRYAIFIAGVRATGWLRGPAPSRANRRWQALAAERRSNVEPASAAELRRGEPESPAAGPVEQNSAAYGQGYRAPDYSGQQSNGNGQSPGLLQSIVEPYNERWPKIDIDQSLRLLAYPPRSLRWR